MNYRQMGERVYIRIDKGEEILAQMVDVCRQLHISAATFQGIGACGEIDYLGGHLKKATVLYTAELVLVPVQGGKIGLRYDAAAGIDVWDLEA